MRCEFCGDKLEGEPFFKEGMVFCSLECADAMESGETMPVDDELLDDPSEYDDDVDTFEDEPGDDDDDEELEEMAYDDDGGDDDFYEEDYGRNF